MKRLFKKGDRVRLGDRTGTVLDEVTHDWLGEPFQVLDIRMDDLDGVSIRIHDVTGTHVTSSSIPQGASSATINISPLPPGLYAITAASDSTTQTTMVVKR